MREISLQVAGREYQTRSFVFKGGEVQVQVPDLPEKVSGRLVVLAQLQSSESLIQLCLLTEILDRVHDDKRTLVIPYLPYARQDRVMATNEAFSLRVVARLINSLGFDKVVVCDPHSDVTPALVDHLQVIPQVDLVKIHEGVGRIIRSNVTIVAPDAGAAKKALAVASYFGLPLITASKARDVKTGAITHTEVHNAEPVKGRNALIVDDICDGGRTFIELAKVLRTAGALKVYLYVTHGIFSQGLGVFEGVLDGIFTTDSFAPPYIEEDQFFPLHISNLIFNANGVAA